jgi:hypothetical protein
MEDPGKKTQIIEILGRQIVVTTLNETQLMLIAREAGRLSRGNLEGRDAMMSVARIMDLLEKTVVQPEDRQWLTDQMVEGNLELKDLMPALTAFSEETPAPVVRRGRPARK